MTSTGTFMQRWRCLLAFSALLPTIGSAATFQVTRLDDPVPDACLPTDCSLREAVLAANAQPGRDIVRLGPGIHRLEQPGIDEDAGLTGDIDITDDLDLLGEGSETSQIDPRQIDYVFDAARGTALTVRGVGFVRSEYVSSPFSGGGIRSGLFGTGDENLGRLTLEDVLIDVRLGNQRVGVLARGQFHASRVTFRRADEWGIAAAFGGHDLRLDDVEFRGNARALSFHLNPNGQARITDTRFIGNGDPSPCNVFSISGTGTTLLQRVSYKNNSTFSGGTLCIRGGAYVIARDSTFAGFNDLVAIDPMGSTAASRLDLHNVTMSARIAITVHTAGSEVNLHHTTLHGLTYAAQLFDGARLRATSSAIVGRCASQGAAVFESIGTNFEAPNRTCFRWPTGSYAFSDASALRLADLQDNGGATETMLPHSDGPLTVLATDAAALCPTTDQRGFIRPRPCTSGAADPLAIDDALLIDGLDY